MSKTLRQVIHSIEQTMAGYYNKQLPLSAADFLVSKDELHNLFGLQAEQSEDWQARASVWVQSEEEESFIGLHFDHQITEHLNLNDPTAGITHDNLDSFCVVAEEVSHFHQLVQHLTDRTSASKLELEAQGEIDKVVVAGVRLADDHGDAHLQALTKKVYQEGQIVAENKDLYWQASKLAAELWQSLFAALPHHRNILANPKINSHLQRIFAAKGSEKLRQITEPLKASA